MSEAVSSVVQMQQSLWSHEWTRGERVRVRMGIHCGEVHDASIGPVGIDVHRAARIAAVAHGGQVVLSEVCAVAVRDLLQDGVSIRDLGYHRLKDLGTPEHVFQLDIAGLETDYPPLRSLDNPDLENNLPVKLSSFVGRETELREVKELLGSSRVVTLAGPGGSGKTRLALQVAADLLDGSGGGVWFTELASLTEPQLVPSAIANAMRIPETQGRAMAETLVDALGFKSTLIILDNCEHLVDACAKLVDSMVRSCRGVCFLVTTREPLLIDGEVVYRLQSMSLPDVDDDLTQVMESEAVSLFVERASAARAGFSLGDHNISAVVSICRRLDGMPLAIELAAARVASMDVGDIESRLNQRFALLTSTLRTAEPRQKTLLAMVEWSYGLLTESERSALRRLSVFSGSFSLEAADAVIGDGSPVIPTHDFLRSLVDKSLVQPDETILGLRYRLLETIRQFGAQKLRDDGEYDDVLAAHASYYLQLAERSAPHLRGPDQAEWLTRVDLEYENVRTAIATLLADDSSGQDVLRMAASLYRFFRLRRRNEGVELFTTVLRHSERDGETLVRAELLGYLGDLIESPERRKHLEEGVRMSRKFSAPALTSELLACLAGCAYHEGDYEAFKTFIQESVQLARPLGDHGLLGRILVRNTLTAVLEHDDVKGVGLCEEALRHLHLGGDRAWEALAYSNLGIFEQGFASYDSASEHYLRALTIAEELGDVTAAIATLCNLGDLAEATGDIVAEQRYISQALYRASRGGYRYGCALLISAVATYVTRTSGRYETAASLHGAADAELDRLEVPWEPGTEFRNTNIEFLKERMGDAFDAAHAAGRKMPFELAVSLAIQAIDALNPRASDASEFSI